MSDPVQCPVLLCLLIKSIWKNADINHRQGKGQVMRSTRNPSCRAPASTAKSLLTRLPVVRGVTDNQGG